MTETHPGYETFTSRLTDLVTTFPPPFIYINDPIASRTTSSVLHSVLSSIAAASTIPPILYARANGVACFTPRLLYDTILNTLAGWTSTWDDGCTVWGAENGRRWNESVDGFVHGLQAVAVDLGKRNPNSTPATTNGKGKGRVGGGEPRIVIVIERAERLKTTLPDLVVPLTRLTELTRLDLTVVMISDLAWEEIKPSLGASPDPYYMEVAIPTKQATLKMLTAAFPQDDSNAHHPALLPLYNHFASTLYDICSPFTKDPDDLAYVAAARWPGFVRPILDEYSRLQREAQEDPNGEEFELMPPSEDARIRLIRLFTPTFTAALEALYPRLTNAADWANENQPRENLFQHELVLPVQRNAVKDGSTNSFTEVLPRISKFILIAAFLASTNPQKSDMRMFGRGPDERKKKRRRGGAGESKKGGAIKIPQRLLGPAPFPLDRMVSILGVLLEEYDADDRPPAPEYSLPGEYTDMEIRRLSVYSSVMELTSMRLLHRTTPADRLDGPPMFKCAISYEAALIVAKHLSVPLNELMWEPA